MRSGLILLICTAALAQGGNNPRELLASVSQAVETATTIQVKGTMSRLAIAGSDAVRGPFSFLISMQGPLHMRYNGLGDRPILWVCDGAYFWTYPAGTGPNFYTKRRASEEICRPPYARWRGLTDHLLSAKFDGWDHSEYEGAPQECEIVEATYESPAASRSSGDEVDRTFCVDVVRHVILRETLELKRASGAIPYSEEVVYSSVEFNPSISAAAFRFDPPQGSQEVLAVTAGISPPTIATKRQPKYTREAIAAKLEGSVILSLVVGSDGRPRDVKVLHPLGLGLDEEAVKAVKNWRFRPASKAGEPVAVQAQVEVNFRLGKH